MTCVECETTGNCSSIGCDNYDDDSDVLCSECGVAPGQLHMRKKCLDITKNKENISDGSEIHLDPVKIVITVEDLEYMRELVSKALVINVRWVPNSPESMLREGNEIRLSNLQKLKSILDKYEYMETRRI